MLGIEFFDSPTHYATVGLIVLAGQFVYATVGFGAGMVTISLLAITFGDVSQYVPFYLLLCLPTEMLVSYRDRERINFRNIRGLLIFIAPSLLLGSYLLKKMESNWAKFLLGIVIAMLAVYYLFYEQKITFTLKNKAWTAGAGMMSGFLAGLYGIGGPPVIFYFKCRKLDKHEFRATLLSIFFSINFLRFPMYLALSLYSLDMVYASAITLPFSMTGLAAGLFIHNLIPEEQFKRLTSIILLVSGSMLVIKNMPKFLF